VAERLVTIGKLDHLGRRLFSYPGEIVRDDGQVIAARCLWTLPKTVDLGPFSIAPGDILIEYYYRDQAFNVFTILSSSGVLKGWYCNVLAGTRITDQTIDWADLALDLVVTPVGEQTVLDEDDFEALAPTAAQRERAAVALNTLNEWVAAGHAPFESVNREFG
jgi:protein associated with RNAse G/E